MDLTTLLTEKTVAIPLEVKTKEECIEKMAEHLVQAGFVKDQVAFVEKVLNREKTGSTGIGFGVAIPHGKSNGVQKPGVAFARLAQPIDWQALDNNPVSLVFLIAVPEESAGNEHLQILAAISRRLIHEEFRQQLMETQSFDDLIETLKNV